MKIQTQIVLLLVLLLSACGRASLPETKNTEPKLPATSIYAGEYSYGGDPEKGPIGSVIIYPKTDSSVVFYMDLNRGAPSYNMGMLLGEVRIKNGRGLYQGSTDELGNGCRLMFEFSNKALVIKTSEKMDECGFGFGVYANGVYDRTSNAVFQFFITGEGEKIYFKDLKPEDYD